MKKILFIWLLFYIGCINKNLQEDFQLQVGDFLFQDLDFIDRCNELPTINISLYSATKC